MKKKTELPDVVSRVDAKALGLKRYFTGDPCMRGHIAERYISNGNCFQCDAGRERKKQKQSYYKQYYEKNKIRIYENFKRYRSKNMEKYAVHSRKHREQNLEKCRVRDKTRHEKISLLLKALRAEMPNLLREFEL